MQPNSTQLQPKAMKLDPVSLMATSKPTSSFTVPSNHVLPNLTAWTLPITECSVPNVAISQLAPQGFAIAPDALSDNTATVPQVVTVTNGGTVY